MKKRRKWADNDNNTGISDIAINHNIDIVKEGCYCSDMPAIHTIYCLIKARYNGLLERDPTNAGYINLMILQELFRYGYISGKRAERARKRRQGR